MPEIYMSYSSYNQPETHIDCMSFDGWIHIQPTSSTHDMPKIAFLHLICSHSILQFTSDSTHNNVHVVCHIVVIKYYLHYSYQIGTLRTSHCSITCAMLPCHHLHFNRFPCKHTFIPCCWLYSIYSSCLQYIVYPLNCCTTPSPTTFHLLLLAPTTTLFSTQITYLSMNLLTLYYITTNSSTIIIEIILKTPTPLPTRAHCTTCTDTQLLLLPPIRIQITFWQLDYTYHSLYFPSCTENQCFITTFDTSHAPPAQTFLIISHLTHRFRHRCQSFLVLFDHIQVWV